MSDLLRVLFISESDSDVGRVVQELEKGGYAVKSRLVSTLKGLSAALKKPDWDIIFLGCRRPQLSTQVALKLLQQNHPDIPVIITSDKMSTPNAAEMMAAGADDYITKRNFKRLVPIVRRELKQAEIHKERRRAEEQIISQSSFALKNPNPVLRVSLDGIILFHNKASSPLLLYWKTAQGKSLPATWQKIIRKIYNEGVNKTAELNHKDTTFVLNIVPVKESEYVNIYATNITERKQAEENLKSRETFLNKIIEQTPNALWISDAEGTVIRMNQALRDLLQLSDEQVVGKYNVFNDIQVKEQGLLPLVKSVFEEGKTVNFTIDYDTKKERQFTGLTKPIHRIIEIIMSPIKNEKGQILNVFCQEKDITEQERAKAALAESETKYRSLFEEATDGIVLCEAETGEIINCNPKFENLTGRTKDQLIGMKQWELRPPEMAETGRQFFREVNEKGQAKRTELIFVEPDGAIVPVETNAKTVTINGKKYIQSILRDISEWKRAESELKFRAELLNAATDSIIVLDDKGRIVYFNDTTCKSLGYTLKEMKEIRLRDLVTAKFFSELSSQVNKMLEEKTEVIFEANMIRKDNSTFPVEVHGRMVQLDNRDYIINLIRDITQRRLQNEAVRVSEENFRNLLAQSPFGIRIVTTQRKGLYSNRALLDMWGYSSLEELEDVPQRERYTPEDYKAFRERAARRQKGEPVPAEYKVNIKRKDGQVRTLAVFNRNVVWNGNPRQLVIYQDITEHNQAEKLLQESEEKYHDLVERANDGICIIQDMTVVYANLRLAQMWGGNVAEITGKRFLDFVYPDSMDMVLDYYKQRMSGNEVPPIYEVFLKRKDGTKLDVELNAGIIVYNEKPADMVIIRDITERKKAEERLADSERTLKAAQTLGRIGSWEISVTGQMTWSDALYDIFERDKTLGPPSMEEMTSLFSPEESKKLQEAVQIALETGQVFRTDVTANLPNGKTVFQHTAVNPIKDENGKIVKYLGIIQDITDRKVAEERVRFQAEILDSGIDAVFVHDLNDKFIYVSQAASQLYGYSQEEFLDSTIELLITKDNLEDIAKKKHEVISTNHLNFNTTHQRKDGTLIPVEIHSRIIEWGGQKLILSVIRDITERKLAEEYLKESERRYRTLFESAIEGISIVDSNTREIKYVNPAFCKILGYRSEEIIGMKVEELHPEKIRPEIIDTFSNVIKVQHTTRTDILPFEKKDGTIISASVNTNAIEIDNKPSVISFLTDVTQREKTTAALIASERRLKEAQALGRIASFEVDQDTFEVYWSDEMYELFDRDRDLPPPLVTEMAGYFSEQEYSRYVEAINIVMEGQENSQDIVINTPSGNTRTLHVLRHPVKDENGKVVKIIGTMQDVTERQQAEEILKESERRLKEAQKLGKIGNFELDIKTNKAFWSEEMFTLLERQYTTEPIPIDEFFKYLSIEGSSTSSGDEAYRQIVETTGDAKDTSVTLPSGKKVFFRVSAEPVKDSNGNIIKIIGTLQDITDRKNVEADLQESYVRLSKTLDGIISTMAATIEIRDPYTSGHQQQVALLAKAIAEEEGLPEETVKAIYTAGIIHDIGKIGIPADILSKPGKLNDIEFALIKTHPNIGYDVLKNIEFTHPLAQWVLQHHERMDGSGYPSGLKGEEISKAARILAVADVVESMISHRPYRPGLGIDAAIEEIEKGKGRLYDAKAVEVCVRLFKEKGFSFS